MGTPAKRFQLGRKEKGGKTTFGLKLGTQGFFRDREAEDSGTVAFSAHPPAILPDPRKEKLEEFAVQKFTDRKKGLVLNRHQTLKTTYLRIQSPIMCDTLESLFRLYDLERSDGYLIAAPFEPLFFGRHEIFQKSQSFEEGSDERAHLEYLLNEVIKHDLYDLITETEDLEKENKTTWNYIWTLFGRGSIVITTEHEGYEQAYQVIDSEYKNENDAPLFYDIKCQSIHFDGVHFGYQETYLTVPHFTGKKKITDLDVYPLRLAAESDYLRNKLIKRGKKVLSYQDVHHVQIGPATVDKTRPNYDELMKDLGRGDVHGRAIVDFFTAATRNPKWNKAVKPLDPPVVQEDDEDNRGKGRNVEAQAREITTGVDGSMRRPDRTAQDANRELVLQDENNLVLMYPLLHAFSLESRKWVTVNVDVVGPVNFIDSAFEHLVADDRYKSHLLSLVEAQKLLPGASADPMPEKGKGLLVLLSGPPGTGKTLMAEAIAEKARQPLYYVDARHLGAHFNEIADNFRIIMANACEWNAIVLLDEADVYLQQRSASAPDGNERVTAFLRQLEYFQGILFMTTNLFETLDKAVESRIHIHLPFESLPYTYRVKIWTNFIKRADVPAIDAADIEKLAFWDINGRQIKNTLRMSLASCRQREIDLTPAIIEEMIGLTSPFAVLKDCEDFDAPSGSGYGSRRAKSSTPAMRRTPDSWRSMPLIHLRGSSASSTSPSRLVLEPPLAPRSVPIMVEKESSKVNIDATLVTPPFLPEVTDGQVPISVEKRTEESPTFQEC